MKKLKIVLKSKLFLIFFIAIIFLHALIFKPANIKKYVVKDIKIKNDITYLYTDHVLIKTKGNYMIGDILTVNGDLLKPNKNTNFNLFNYRNYLYSKKIYYVLNNPIIIREKSNNIFYKIKNNIINIINKRDDKDYLYAFILGDKDYIDDDVKSSISSNGISHLLCVSGMHVTILSIGLLWILNHIHKNKFNEIIVIIFIYFYAFLINFSPSIMRVFYMYVIGYINKIFKLNIDMKYVVIYLFLFNILLNPYAIYDIGFLFSYIITYFIIKYQSIIKRCNNYISKLFMVSLISFMASVPILIYNFNEINLLSPFINIIFVPLITFIIFPLSIISFIVPNDIFMVTTNLFEQLSLFFENYKLSIIIPHISIYIFILYYILIIFILNMINKRRYGYFFIFLILLILHSNIFNLNNEVHILDVGQGDSSIIRYKFNKVVLIDTGGNYQSDISKYVTIPYLKSLGIKKIDYLILTHGDFDHMGEAINLVNNFKVEKVIFNCGEYNDLEKELIKVLDKKNIKYYSCINELNIDKNKLYFLQTKEYDNENDNSNVIYTELNGYKFMFMGDASTITEKEILNKYNLPNIDVLKVGHHGSKTSSSQEFIDSINSKYSVISVGKNNRYGHPNKEALENLSDSKIYRTDLNGSIMFKIKNKKLKVETCTP